MLVLVLAGSVVRGQTKTGIISSDETWSDTVLIIGLLSVRDAVVTIMPGTKVRFNHSPPAFGLGIRTNGAIQAVGTATQPILFTTADTSVDLGKWGEIDLYENINVSQTRFEYCIFEAGTQALDFRSTNHDAVQSPNAITIENCTFRNLLTGIYITSGGSPTIRHCVFHNINSAGIFAHGAGSVTVEYCTIYNNSAGIINCGEPNWGWDQAMAADHLTIHHIDGDLATTEKWWTGYGIYCSGASNQRGTISLTNSIISDVTFKNNSHTISGGPIGFSIGSWTATHDYNCYYQAGYRAVTPGDPGDHAVEAAPLFVNPDSGDFRLQWGSPCIGAGSDGSNIGVSQEVGIRETVAVSPAPIREISIKPNPFHWMAVISTAGVKGALYRAGIYDLQGRLVNDLLSDPVPGHLIWDGTDRAGNKVPGGVYTVILNTGYESIGKTVIFSP
jgi:hypothetical protein